MPYNPDDLSLSDPTSVEWAVAWARFLLGDRTEPEQWTDAELQAMLASTAFQHNGTAYHRPHHAAAALLESDPTRPLSESLMSASVQHRDPLSTARSIRRQATWVDDLIQAATGVRPAGRSTLEVTW